MICSLAGHRADPASERWNAGICFARCARCTSDLVRGAGGEWIMPRGFRVVWRATETQPTLQDAEAAAQPPALAAAARETLFERLRSKADAMAAEQGRPVPVDADESEGAGTAEWPIGSAEVARAADEPLAPTVPEDDPAPEIAEEPAQFEAADFMDDGADADDWGDFGETGARRVLV